MKILYGIQGTGNGHLTRARALVPALRKANIDMDFVFSGRPREDFFDMEVFGDDYRCFSGLSLVTEKGQLKTFRTVAENKLGEFIKDIKSLSLDDYDLVLSDFEPVTAWAAKVKGKASIGISHQCAFFHDIPKVPGYPLARLLMNIFAPVSIKIGLHWHHFDQPILPPLIEPHQVKPVIPDKILVYMGFETIEDITRFLSPFKNYQFIVYAKVDSIQHYDNITVKPLSTTFHQDLEDAAGVISNAGFELASECLQLGKKLLIKPLLGQYEQLSNALALQQLGRATVMYSLDNHLLEKWLLESANEPIAYPDTATHLAQWLANGDWNNTDSLKETLWKDVNLGAVEKQAFPGSKTLTA